MRIPILAGILPLDSLRHAEFMANEVPGRAACRTRCSSGCGEADAAGRAADEGIAIAREVVAGIRPLVQGIQIATAAGAIEAALDVAGNRSELSRCSAVRLAPAGTHAL